MIELKPSLTRASKNLYESVNARKKKKSKPKRLRIPKCECSEDEMKRTSSNQSVKPRGHKRHSRHKVDEGSSIASQPSRTSRSKKPDSIFACCCFQKNNKAKGSKEPKKKISSDSQLSVKKSQSQVKFAKKVEKSQSCVKSERTPKKQFSTESELTSSLRPSSCGSARQSSSRLSTSDTNVGRFKSSNGSLKKSCYGPIPRSNSRFPMKSDNNDGKLECIESDVKSSNTNCNRCCEPQKNPFVCPCKCHCHNALEYYNDWESSRKSLLECSCDNTNWPNTAPDWANERSSLFQKLCTNQWADRQRGSNRSIESSIQSTEELYQWSDKSSLLRYQCQLQRNGCCCQCGKPERSIKKAASNVKIKCCCQVQNHQLIQTEESRLPELPKKVSCACATSTTGLLGENEKMENQKSTFSQGQREKISKDECTSYDPPGNTTKLSQEQKAETSTESSKQSSPETESSTIIIYKGPTKPSDQSRLSKTPSKRSKRNSSKIKSRSSSCKESPLNRKRKRRSSARRGSSQNGTSHSMVEECERKQNEICCPKNYPTIWSNEMGDKDKKDSPDSDWNVSGRSIDNSSTIELRKKLPNIALSLNSTEDSNEKYQITVPTSSIEKAQYQHIPSTKSTMLKCTTTTPEHNSMSNKKSQKTSSRMCRQRTGPSQQSEKLVKDTDLRSTSKNTTNTSNIKSAARSGITTCVQRSEKMVPTRSPGLKTSPGSLSQNTTAQDLRSRVAFQQNSLMSSSVESKGAKSVSNTKSSAKSDSTIISQKSQREVPSGSLLQKCGIGSTSQQTRAQSAPSCVGHQTRSLEKFTDLKSVTSSNTNVPHLNSSAQSGLTASIHKSQGVVQKSDIRSPSQSTGTQSFRQNSSKNMGKVPETISAHKSGLSSRYQQSSMKAIFPQLGSQDPKQGSTNTKSRHLQTISKRTMEDQPSGMASVQGKSSTGGLNKTATQENQLNSNNKVPLKHSIQKCSSIFSTDRYLKTKSTAFESFSKAATETVPGPIFSAKSGLSNDHKSHRTLPLGTSTQISSRGSMSQQKRPQDLKSQSAVSRSDAKSPTNISSMTNSAKSGMTGLASSSQQSRLQGFRSQAKVSRCATNTPSRTNLAQSDTGTEKDFRRSRRSVHKSDLENLSENTRSFGLGDQSQETYRESRRYSTNLANLSKRNSTSLPFLPGSVNATDYPPLSKTPKLSCEPCCGQDTCEKNNKLSELWASIEPSEKCLCQILNDNDMLQYSQEARDLYKKWISSCYLECTSLKLGSKKNITYTCRKERNLSDEFQNQQTISMAQQESLVSVLESQCDVPPSRCARNCLCGIDDVQGCGLESCKIIYDNANNYTAYSDSVPQIPQMSMGEKCSKSYIEIFVSETPTIVIGLDDDNTKCTSLAKYFQTAPQDNRNGRGNCLSEDNSAVELCSCQGSQENIKDDCDFCSCDFQEDIKNDCDYCSCDSQDDIKDDCDFCSCDFPAKSEQQTKYENTLQKCNADNCPVSQRPRDISPKRCSFKVPSDASVTYSIDINSLCDCPRSCANRETSNYKLRLKISLAKSKENTDKSSTLNAKNKTSRSESTIGRKQNRESGGKSETSISWIAANRSGQRNLNEKSTKEDFNREVRAHSTSTRIHSQSACEICWRESGSENLQNSKNDGKWIDHRTSGRNQSDANSQMSLSLYKERLSKDSQKEPKTLNTEDVYKPKQNNVDEFDDDVFLQRSDDSVPYCKRNTRTSRSPIQQIYKRVSQIKNDSSVFDEQRNSYDNRRTSRAKYDNYKYISSSMSKNTKDNDPANDACTCKYRRSSKFVDSQRHNYVSQEDYDKSMRLRNSYASQEFLHNDSVSQEDYGVKACDKQTCPYRRPSSESKHHLAEHKDTENNGIPPAPDHRFKADANRKTSNENQAVEITTCNQQTCDKIRNSSQESHGKGICDDKTCKYRYPSEYKESEKTDKPAARSNCFKACCTKRSTSPRNRRNLHKRDDDRKSAKPAARKNCFNACAKKNSSNGNRSNQKGLFKYTDNTEVLTCNRQTCPRRNKNAENNAKPAARSSGCASAENQKTPKISPKPTDNVEGLACNQQTCARIQGSTCTYDISQEISVNSTCNDHTCAGLNNDISQTSPRYRNESVEHNDTNKQAKPSTCSSCIAALKKALPCSRNRNNSAEKSARPPGNSNGKPKGDADFSYASYYNATCNKRTCEYRNSARSSDITDNRYTVGSDDNAKTTMCCGCWQSRKSRSPGPRNRTNSRTVSPSRLHEHDESDEHAERHRYPSEYEESEKQPKTGVCDSCFESRPNRKSSPQKQDNAENVTCQSGRQSCSLEHENASLYHDSIGSPDFSNGSSNYSAFDRNRSKLRGTSISQQFNYDMTCDDQTCSETNLRKQENSHKNNNVPEKTRTLACSWFRACKKRISSFRRRNSSKTPQLYNPQYEYYSDHHTCPCSELSPRRQKNISYGRFDNRSQLKAYSLNNIDNYNQNSYQNRQICNYKNEPMSQAFVDHAHYNNTMYRTSSPGDQSASVARNSFITSGTSTTRSLQNPTNAKDREDHVDPAACRSCTTSFNCRTHPQRPQTTSRYSSSSTNGNTPAYSKGSNNQHNTNNFPESNVSDNKEITDDSTKRNFLNGRSTEDIYKSSSTDNDFFKNKGNLPKSGTPSKQNTISGVVTQSATPVLLRPNQVDMGTSVKERSIDETYRYCCTDCRSSKSKVNLEKAGADSKQNAISSAGTQSSMPVLFGRTEKTDQRKRSSSQVATLTESKKSGKSKYKPQSPKKDVGLQISVHSIHSGMTCQRKDATTQCECHKECVCAVTREPGGQKYPILTSYKPSFNAYYHQTEYQHPVAETRIQNDKSVIKQTWTNLPKLPNETCLRTNDQLPLQCSPNYEDDLMAMFLKRCMCQSQGNRMCELSCGGLLAKEDNQIEIYKCANADLLHPQQNNCENHTSMTVQPKHESLISKFIESVKLIPCCNDNPTESLDSTTSTGSKRRKRKFRRRQHKKKKKTKQKGTSGDENDDGDGASKVSIKGRNALYDQVNNSQCSRSDTSLSSEDVLNMALNKLYKAKPCPCSSTTLSDWSKENLIECKKLNSIATLKDCACANGNSPLREFVSKEQPMKVRVLKCHKLANAKETCAEATKGITTKSSKKLPSRKSVVRA